MSPGTDFLNLDFFPIYVIVILIGVIVSIILVPYFGKNRKEKKWLYILLGVLCIAAVTGIICAILAITGNPGFENTGIIIRWYAVCIILGFGLAIFVAAYLFKQKGLKPSLVFDFAIVLIPLCILGARTFYVAFDSNSSVNSFLGFLNIMEGGLSIYGGIIGGFIAIVIVCLYKKINILDIADCVAVGLILGQAIGRWGNFFNQEVYGQPITDPNLQWFPFGVLIGNRWHQALFFYEFFFNLIGFVCLFILAKKYNNKAKGIIVCSYLIFYGIVRACLEGLRDQRYILGDGFQASLIVSIIIIAVGAAGMIFQLVMYEKKRKLQIDKELGLAAADTVAESTVIENIEPEKTKNKPEKIKSETNKTKIETKKANNGIEKKKTNNKGTGNRNKK